jgi:hypothetical protein
MATQMKKPFKKALVVLCGHFDGVAMPAARLVKIWRIDIVERALAVVGLHHLQRRTLLDHHSAHSFRRRQDFSGQVGPQVDRQRARPDAGGAKACPGVKAFGSVAEMGSHKEAARPLERVLGGLVGFHVLGAREWCRGHGLCEIKRALSQDAEKRYDFAVQIIVDLETGTRLRTKNSGTAAEGLDVGLVGREKADDLPGQADLPAVVS